MVETGQAPGGGYSQTLQGNETNTLSETGNTPDQTFQRSVTGSGSYSLQDSGLGATLASGPGSNSYSLQESGDWKSGSLSQTETGQDRYSLLQGFINVSNAAPGAGPGNLDYSPFGEPYSDIWPFVLIGAAAGWYLLGPGASPGRHPRGPTSIWHLPDRLPRMRWPDYPVPPLARRGATGGGNRRCWNGGREESRRHGEARAGTKGASVTKDRCADPEPVNIACPGKSTWGCKNGGQPHKQWHEAAWLEWKMGSLSIRIWKGICPR